MTLEGLITFSPLELASILAPCAEVHGSPYFELVQNYLELFPSLVLPDAERACENFVYGRELGDIPFRSNLVLVTCARNQYARQLPSLEFQRHQIVDRCEASYGVDYISLVSSGAAFHLSMHPTGQVYCGINPKTLNCREMHPSYSGTILPRF